MFGKHKQSRRPRIVSYSTKKLYHGTPVNFDAIDVERNVGSSLDLGSGFYTTEDRDYALMYAKTGATFAGTDVGYVRKYLFDEDLAKEKLDVKYIDGPDMEWFDHLISYRIPPFARPPYDITVGPSADNEIKDIVNEYNSWPIKRTIEKKLTIRRLEPYVYPTQYVFISFKKLAHRLKILQIYKRSPKGPLTNHRNLSRITSLVGYRPDHVPECHFIHQTRSRSGPFPVLPTLPRLLDQFQLQPRRSKMTPISLHRSLSADVYRCDVSRSKEPP